jgi:hypothetical protein
LLGDPYEGGIEKRTRNIKEIFKWMGKEWSGGVRRTAWQVVLRPHLQMMYAKRLYKNLGNYMCHLLSYLNMWPTNHYTLSAVAFSQKEKKVVYTPGVQAEGMEWIILAQDRN